VRKLKNNGIPKSDNISMFKLVLRDNGMRVKLLNLLLTNKMFRIDKLYSKLYLFPDKKDKRDNYRCLVKTLHLVELIPKI